MQFEYLYQISAMGNIDIEDIGNVCLSATNTLYQEYILIIFTEQGKSKIISYGPRFVDLKIAPSSVSYTYNEIDFKQSKLIRVIEQFLNNPKHMISQVQEITLEEAKDKIKDLVEYL